VPSVLAASIAIYGEPKIRAELRYESVAEHDGKFVPVGKIAVLPTKSAEGIALFSYIEGLYNPRRRHNSIGMMAPNTFETRATKNNKFGAGKSHCDHGGLPTAWPRG